MPKRGDKVYRRKDGLWEARYVKGVDELGRKKYGSVYAHTCGEAKEKRQAALDAMVLFGGAQTARNITVGRLVAEWLQINRERVKQSTLRRYEGFNKNHINTMLGSLPAISCGTAVIHGFACRLLESGLSSISVNAILVFLHSCLKYGQKEYHLPMPDFVYFPREKEEMRVLSQAEQCRLENYLLEGIDVYKFGVLLTLYTGLRVGELCALRWCDVEGGTIAVRRTMQRLGNGAGASEVVVTSPKTKTSARSIPLPPFLCEYVERFRRFSAPDEYVLSAGGRKIVEPRVMQYKFKKYIAAVGIEGATFHTLRHSFATRCIDRYGFDVKTLSEILGHSSVEMTLNRYVHSSMDLKRDSMARLCLLS